MEYYVSVDGSDSNSGDKRAPLQTISAAADLAQPGDVITVHEGVYRERVDPPRGGTAEDNRIVYRAAPDESVDVKGSEIVSDWELVEEEIWKTSLSNDVFGKYNPYDDRIRGDWFDNRGRDHHTGDVYLNEESLVEATGRDAVRDADDDQRTWYADVDGIETTIWARFGGADPMEEVVEINVRPAVFYPSRTGVDYLAVRGFRMCHAATQWAPPTTEQIGLIGTHWSRGWIIENNVVSHSRCTGITLGKYGKSVDDTGATADRYNETIRDALENGWEKGSIGHHIVRNNTVSHCEQAGIVGSMGAAFSMVIDNHIHHINVKRQFGGAELAGIKFHGPIDSTIAGNRVHHARRGLWLDWMTQGTRVTRNLLYENDLEDLFVEVNHGPFLVDTNLLLSDRAILTMSQGGAYVHNLIAGDVVQRPEQSRSTPYHEPHSTEIGGLSNVEGGDDRYYNNVIVGRNGLSTYDDAELLIQMDGNVFAEGAEPSIHENPPIEEVDCAVELTLTDDEDSIFLNVAVEGAWDRSRSTHLVTTDLLGKAAIPKQQYTNPDGTALTIDTDYFGTERSSCDPHPGPFEASLWDEERLKI